ncbi:hypothetical protein [Micromonospora sp. WMMD736]|uniref:hypothetical protein n=1 Tax=Micromonospora sp. WMMD736 TaxID=3404112 RepID=UPI003B943D29
MSWPTSSACRTALSQLLVIDRDAGMVVGGFGLAGGPPQGDRVGIVNRLLLANCSGLFGTELPASSP